MIVFDEDLRNPELRTRLANWNGTVIVVTDPPVAAPRGTDDADLLRFLRNAPDCVFVTANNGDFYGQLDGDPTFCIVELDLGASSNDNEDVYQAVRAVLRSAPFNTVRSRNGLVIRANRQEAWYYRRRSDPDSRKGRVVF